MRERSFLSSVDNILLVVVAVVVGIVFLNIVAGLFGFVWFLAKIALVTAVVAGVWRAVGSGRGRELANRKYKELKR